MERLEKIYKALSDRWNLTVKFGGEWNDGYAEGVKYAMGVVYEEKRKIERKIERSQSQSIYKKVNHKKSYDHYKKGAE